MILFPRKSFTVLMFLAAIRLCVPTARLLRKIFTLAPPPMARIESTIDELPMSPLPAATCCNERALAPELMKSTLMPSSAKNPFWSATIAGQIDTLTPMMMADTVVGAARWAWASDATRLAARASPITQDMAKRGLHCLIVIASLLWRVGRLAENLRRHRQKSKSGANGASSCPWAPAKRPRQPCVAIAFGLGIRQQSQWGVRRRPG